MGFAMSRWLSSALAGVVMACAPPRPREVAATRSTPAPALSPAPVDAPPKPPPRPVVELVAPFTAGVHGMALSPDGTLFFSDSFGRRDKVRRVYTLASPYDGEPRPTTIVGATPAGLAFIGGSLYVCDVGAGTVTAYDASFAVVAAWSVKEPWNVARHPSLGLVTVTHDGRVAKLAPDGGVTELFGGGLAPFALAVDAKGGLWMSEQGAAQGDPGRVTRREADGAIAEEIAYPWANPEGLAIGADGLLWIAETERGELLRVAADDRVEVIKAGLTLPVIVTAAPDGALFVSTGGAAPELLRVRFTEPPLMGR
jgi:sugar lactone lactonase YvrE